MNQNACYSNKMLGLGISVITFLSIATVSPNAFNDNITLSTNNQYNYEAISSFNDNQGELCISSELAEQSSGEFLSDENYKLTRNRERKSVQLQITKISKHVSYFDFEDEYEEI